MHCPSCRSQLVERKVGEAQVKACPDCGGTLVATNQLIRLLEAIAGPMLKVMDVDADIEKVEPIGVATPCPACGKRMERFWYMGSPLVTLDRCGDEWLVWAQADGLGGAAALYARTNRRMLERKSKDDALREGMARSTRARNAGRAAMGRLAAGLVVGGVVGGVAVGIAEELNKRD